MSQKQKRLRASTTKVAVSRRRLAGVGVGLGTVLGLGLLPAGCAAPWDRGQVGEAPRGAGVEQAAGQVRYANSMSGQVDIETVHQPTVERFSQQSPRIQVTLELTHFNEYPAKIISQQAAGTAPDVIGVGKADIHRFMGAGIYRPLDALVKRDRYDLQDYFPKLLEEMRLKGTLHTLPSSVVPYVLLFNQARFDQAGVAYPGAALTLDAFVESARQLTRRESTAGASGTSATGVPAQVEAAAAQQAQFGAEMSTRIYDHLAPWVHAFGGKIVDRIDEPQQVVNDVRAVDALQWVADLYLRHRVLPTDAERQQLPQAFFTGHAAMWVSRYIAGRIETGARNFSWDLAPLPSGRAGRHTILAYGGYGIGSQSKVIEAAWALVQFLGGPEAAVIAPRPELVQLSPRRTVAQATFLKIPTPAHRRVVVEAMDYAQPTPKTARLPDLNQVISEEVGPVWEGSTSARAAWERIVQRGTQALRG